MPDFYTTSFVLLWDIACLEAQAGTHDCIRPEHLFIALCKAGDFPIGALRDDGSPELQQQLPAIQKELNAVREAFDAAGFDRKLVRRQVRLKLGQPNLKPLDGVWHRTEEAKWCCDRAVRIAKLDGRTQAAPFHLLQAFVDPEAHFPILEPYLSNHLRNKLRD